MICELASAKPDLHKNPLVSMIAVLMLLLRETQKRLVEMKSD
ncbi:hypothetical protein [Bradyrhizobium sp. LMG 9283]